MTLTTAIWAGISAKLVGSPDLGSTNYDLARAANQNLADGTGNNQADLLFTDQRTLALSANEDLDLAGGLTDPLGVTLTFAKIKAILVRAATTNGGNIIISPAAANGFLGPFGDASDQIVLPAGGAALISAPVAGWAVTAGTGDLLNISNSDGAASAIYDIVLAGTSA